MKLSNIMWVQAGHGMARKLMPFVIKNEIIISLSDDRLFQLDSSKSIFDNIYEICQTEYGASTVIMGKGTTNDIPHLDTSIKSQPKILGVKLPVLLVLTHRNEYKSTGDMTVSNNEVKALTKHISKQLSKPLEK